jgi:8-oxo-dGTP pyrophosphatase MutT (NUDIX family)
MKVVFLEKPKVLNPKFEVVSCFVRCGDCILLLHRQDHKPEGNSWGVPAGKVDQGETIHDAMVRELQEEIGLIASADCLKRHVPTYVTYPEKHFVYHIFEIELDKMIDVKLNNEEHKNYEWATLEDALKKDLILGEDECIELYYK